jgi:eukaryotic-like serine/threonine-protein kinase
MPSVDWQKIEELFVAALEVAPAERTAWLDRQCEGDAALLREVGSLLAAEIESADFLHGSPLPKITSLLLDETETSRAGQHIGPYKILDELGRGGMGVVYLAEREDDQFRQRVAIKLIKRGLDTEDILRRFRNERQILASLNHPNIGKLFDGGTTEDGLPFFVMEYIAGLPLLQYCDKHDLSTTERLQLFRHVCAAVQHAHQNLVIHRDLKPSNILVNEEGEVKLLDFGVAKLLNPELTDEGLTQTQAALRVMTPEYASPEQVRGQHVSTATDIYSLGVILYQLLTGLRPFKLKDTSPEELSRVICDSEPTKPSDALSSQGPAASDNWEAAGLRTPDTGRRRNQQFAIRNPKLLRGDIDNIILMALRKDPARRYKSVEQFSADIERHLKGLPVIARKDTFKYRAGKFVSRNRLAVAAAAVILCSLIGGIVTTAWQARVAARQARAAQQEKDKAESISAFLGQVLNSTNPVLKVSHDSSRERTITEVLDEAARRLESGEFDNQPEVKAELERIIANSYNGQGRHRLADQHEQEYVDLQSRLYGENDPRTLAASAYWAQLLFTRGELTEAENKFRQVLPLMRTEQQKGNLKAEVLQDALLNFAYVRRTQGDSREAESLFREVLAMSSQIPVGSLYPIAMTRSTLASTLADQGRFDEALQTAREAVREARQQGESDRPDFGFSLTVLGGFLTDKGDFAEADATLREGEAIFRRLLSPSHLWLGDNLRNQAICLYRQNKFAEAQSKVDETLKIYLESFGVQYDNYPTALITKGLILNKTGKSREGEMILREAVKLRTGSLPEEHFWIAVANGALGECLTTQKRYAEAEPLLVQSYDSLNWRLGKRDPRTNEALLRLLKLYDEWGRPAQAAQYRAFSARPITVPVSPSNAVECYPCREVSLNYSELLLLHGDNITRSPTRRCL